MTREITINDFEQFKQISTFVKGIDNALNTPFEPLPFIPDRRERSLVANEGTRNIGRLSILAPVFVGTAHEALFLAVTNTLISFLQDAGCPNADKQNSATDLLMSIFPGKIIIPTKREPDDAVAFWKSSDARPKRLPEFASLAIG